MKVGTLLVSVAVVWFAACKPDPPPPPRSEPGDARLLTAEIDPAAGTYYWLPAVAVAVDFESVPGLEVAALDASLSPIGGAQPTTTDADAVRPDIVRVALGAATGLHVLQVTAPEGTPPIEVRLAVTAGTWEALAETTIASPVVRLPGGEPVLELAGVDDFVGWAQTTYGYDPREGIPFLTYLAIAELAEWFCPVGAPPPPGGPGARPPAGSQHDDSYCAISAFVHSMQRYFPTALPADVTTNPTSWDEVGENLDHSNTFGVSPGELVDEVNDNYGTHPPKSRDGKTYCAAELDDTSAANLAAWAEDCDIKMCVIDVTGVFGHWVDITGVDAGGKKLTFQDYGATGTVNYSEDSENVDFSSAPGTTMAGQFKGTNVTAGDGIGESVSFAVVCECDTSSGEPGMPAANGLGQTLNP